MKKLILSLFLISTFNISYAQWSMGFGMAGACPLLELNDNGYKDGLGYSFTVLSKPFPQYYNWQVQLGGNLNHFWAGKEKGTIKVDEPRGADATYKILNKNTAISFKTRLISRPNAVRFHADLDLGYRGFKSHESIILNELDTNYVNRYDSTLARGGNVFVGLTAGLLFRISESFYLDLYSRVDYGFNSTWYDLNSFSVSNNNAIYNDYVYRKTHTPILWVGFTASFNFDGGSNTPTKRPSNPSSGANPYNPPYSPPKSNPKPPKIQTPKSNPKPAPKPIKPKPGPPGTGPR